MSKVDIVEVPKPEDQIVLTLTPDEAALVGIAVSGMVCDGGTYAIKKAFDTFNGEEEYFNSQLNVDITEVDLYRIFINLTNAVRKVRPNV